MIRQKTVDPFHINILEPLAIEDKPCGLCTGHPACGADLGITLKSRTHAHLGIKAQQKSRQRKEQIEWIKIEHTLYLLRNAVAQSFIDQLSCRG